MAFVPESVKLQLELCKSNGTLDFAKTGLTDIPEQVCATTDAWTRLPWMSTALEIRLDQSITIHSLRA